MRKRILGGIVIVGALAAGAGGAMAVAGGGDSEGGVTGPQADRAIRAALEATGGGTANAVERDSEDGATWEVEVPRADGKTVDGVLALALGGQRQAARRYPHCDKRIDERIVMACRQKYRASRGHMLLARDCDAGVEPVKRDSGQPAE